MNDLMVWMSRAQLSAVKTDDGRWIVEGYAMTAGRKSDNLDITLEAMRGMPSLEGLPVYVLSGELPDPTTDRHMVTDGDVRNVVGRVLSSFVDDVGMFVRVLISRSEEDVWTKIQERILKDFSIYAKVAARRLQDGTMEAVRVLARHLAIVVNPVDAGAQFSVASRAEGVAGTQGIEVAADAAGEASSQGGGSGAGCGVGEAVVLAGMAAVTGAALMAAAAVMEE